ncbi:MAG: 3-deoxy-manno-octulosonate cytidylyltransferase [Planctomycetes bacterium]|nr:3-deoxy-manno-octulosonate cytidylyltransferase [Planctomycetota bacterium]
MSVQAIAIIPARLGSTRFPGKVLAAQTGKPLIQHVWESAKRATSLARVVIATDDESVRAAVVRFGGEAVMTSPDHPNGSSRLAEAARHLSLPDDALVVNVQGDEPEMEPQVVDAAVELARLSGAEVATVASPFQPGEDPANPNLVKVVVGMHDLALYFSRSLIPHQRVGGDASAGPLRHVGLYVYRAAFLQRYVSLPPTPLERTEMLEQLRVLEHGYKVAVAVRDCRGQGIDTPEQYAEFVRRVKSTAN